MRKLLIIMVCLLLMACSKEESFFFRASVIEVNDGSYIVQVDQEDIDIATMDLFSISTDETFQLGDYVIIEFDGTVMESYPGQLNLISIDLVQE